MKRAIESGFTLVELMVTLVIVSVLSTVALGAIRPQIEHARKVAATEVVQSLARDCAKAMVANDQMLEPQLSTYNVEQVTFSKSGECWFAEDDITLSATPSSRHRIWTEPVKSVAQYATGIARQEADQ